MPNVKTEVLHGDLLKLSDRLPTDHFQLVYLDPPFFTQKKFKARNTAGGFTDSWQNGLQEYLEYLEKRLVIVRDTLSNDGSLLLHLDWRVTHYARVICDRIFGFNNFQNEIIWKYNSGGGSKKRYGRKHDTILWYGKTSSPYFNPEEARVPYDAVIAKKRAHLFNPKGKVSGDVLDIPRPPNHAKEWTGWPTQKPLALLKFFVRCHSEEGSQVGDFFCGSGTTLVAAKELGRNALGCDISRDAVRLAQMRLSGSIDTGKSSVRPLTASAGLPG